MEINKNETQNQSVKTLISPCLPCEAHCAPMRYTFICGEIKTSRFINMPQKQIPNQYSTKVKMEVETHATRRKYELEQIIMKLRRTEK